LLDLVIQKKQHITHPALVFRQPCVIDTLRETHS